MNLEQLKMQFPGMVDTISDPTGQKYLVTINEEKYKVPYVKVDSTSMDTKVELLVDAELFEAINQDKPYNLVFNIDPIRYTLKDAKLTKVTGIRDNDTCYTYAVLSSHKIEMEIQSDR